ncbi:MAG TPA: 5'-methylthioadenosine/adenosylhomocysteine nucleosidase [Haloplasmataceae bacterium]
MIGIIGAMEEEVESLKKLMNDLEIRSYRGFLFYKGKIADKDIVLMQSGIGKVNASVGTTILLEHFLVELIINIGTAGGIKPSCEVLDIVLSEKVSYHDVDVTAFQYEYGQVPKCPRYFTSDEKLLNLTERILKEANKKYHKGLIVSGDAFIHDEKQIKNIAKYFPEALAVEMEAAAISHVCYIYKIPFIVIRSLSDIAGKKSAISFDKYLQLSSENACMIVKKLIEKVPLGTLN